MDRLGWIDAGISLIFGLLCVQVLPCLLEVMRDVPSRDSAASLVCLQFIYWSMLQLDAAVHGPQV